MMLKYLFALALLAPIGFCRFTPAERQWKESDERYFNCSTACEKTCKCECNENQCKRCTATENKCDRVAYPDRSSCGEEFWEDVCVPGHCECRAPGVSEDCPIICKVECPPTGQPLYTQKCPTADVDGCKQNDYCEEVKAGCTGFCPVTCEENQKKCPVPDDSEGCPVKPICIEKTKKTESEDYCETHCPVVCTDPKPQRCPGLIDHEGCPGPQTCIEACVKACPIEDCKGGQIKCNGKKHCDETKCVERDFCKDPAKDVNEDPCPADSQSHGCPENDCCDGIVCPAKKDENGCRKPSTCTARPKVNDTYCPDHSYCECGCEPHQVCCKNQHTDEMGCKEPDDCIDQERDYTGKLCAVHCPCDCSENEICCPGFRNSAGCLEAPTCETIPTKTAGDCKGEPCPAFCPVCCNHDQVKCLSQIDPCDGCPTEEVCRNKVNDRNGQECSVDPLSASHNCPKLCDELHGYILCPARMNSEGCKDAAQCRKRTNDTDGNYCPHHSVCSVFCKDNEIRCDGGMDSRDCKMESFCHPKGSDKDGNMCEGFCPPRCNKAQEQVDQPAKANECPSPPTCQDPPTNSNS